jgi:hypothetical protein
LASQGLPADVARLLLWIAKLIVFGALLYAAFWLAVLLAFFIVAVWLLSTSGADEEKQPELRDGHSGIGLYDKDDWRIDIGEPDEP